MTEVFNTDAEDDCMFEYAKLVCIVGNKRDNGELIDPELSRRIVRCAVNLLKFEVGELKNQYQQIVDGSGLSSTAMRLLATSRSLVNVVDSFEAHETTQMLYHLAIYRANDYKLSEQIYQEDFWRVVADRAIQRKPTKGN